MALLYVVTCGGLVDTVIVKVKLLPAKIINKNQEKLITKKLPSLSRWVFG